MMRKVWKEHNLYNRIKIQIDLDRYELQAISKRVKQNNNYESDIFDWAKNLFSMLI